MRVCRAAFACAIGGFIATSVAQAAVGDWKSYTRLILRDIAATQTEVWAATEGGIIRSDLARATVRTYSPTDRLPDKTILSVLIDGRTVWFGTGEGGLVRFTSRPGLDQPVLETPLLTGQVTMIAALALGDSDLYIGHSTGVTVLNRRTNRVVETYHQLGPSSELRNTQITALAVMGNRIIAGSARGLSYGNLADNLLLPGSWTYVTSFDSVGAIASFAGAVYVATKTGVRREGTSGWSTVLSSARAYDLAVFDGAIWAATDKGLFVSVDGAAWTQAAGLTTPIRALSAVPGTMLVAAGSEGTFRVSGKDATTATKVPGVDIPPSDSFTHLALDSSGAVWVAPGGTPFGGVFNIARFGVFALKDDRWLHFPSGVNGMLNLPGGETDTGFITIAVDAQNRVWTGNWGTGLNIIDQMDSPPTIRAVTASNSPLRGLNVNPNYMVIRALLRDPSGAMWVASQEGGIFAAVPGYEQGEAGMVNVSRPFVESGQISQQVLPTALAVDRFGVFWIGTFGDGVILLDPGGTPTDSLDDRLVGSIGLEGVDPGAGLLSRRVTSIAVDLEGVVWVGTEAGLTAFRGNFDRPSNTYTISATHYTVNGNLPSDRIQAVIADSSNVKWIGTNRGLAQILRSGQVVNLASSPLVDPEGSVMSLAFDARRGYLWIGTPRGLNRYEAYPPHGGGDEVIGQPSSNPYRIGLAVRGPDYVLTGPPLTMLVSPGATVRIYTLAGELVWEKTDGGIGQVSWDGRTFSGRGVVASGIYLYLVERSGRKKMGKIAVLRDAR